MAIKILEAQAGEGKKMLQGKIQLEGFAEMYFALWDGTGSKSGTPWLQLTKSFKVGDSKWANSVWINKGAACDKVIDLLMEEHRKKETEVANDAAEYALPDDVAISDVSIGDIPF